MQKQNLEINELNNIDHKTYEEKEKIKKKDFENIEAIEDIGRKKEVEELDLIQTKIDKFIKNDAIKKKSKG